MTPHTSTEPACNSIVSLAVSGDFAEAWTKRPRLRTRPLPSEAWRLIARTNANMQRFGAALRSARNRTATCARIRGRCGSSGRCCSNSEGAQREALAELEALESEAPDSPQLLVQLGRALQFAGPGARGGERKSPAALETWPADVALHVLLAELRWQRGAGAAATSAIERAIEKFPGELKLRLVAADLLRNSGRAGRALAACSSAASRSRPSRRHFLTSIGVVVRRSRPAARGAAAV